MYSTARQQPLHKSGGISLSTKTPSITAIQNSSYVNALTSYFASHTFLFCCVKLIICQIKAARFRLFEGQTSSLGSLCPCHIKVVDRLLDFSYESRGAFSFVVPSWLLDDEVQDPTFISSSMRFHLQQTNVHILHYPRFEKGRGATTRCYLHDI